MKIDQPLVDDDFNFNILYVHLSSMVLLNAINLLHRRSETITGHLFGSTYSARPEFAVQDRGGILQAFIEVR